MKETTAEVHPLLTSMTLAFWRTRLLVEREAGTTPLKLLILAVAHNKDGVSPGQICREFDLDVSRVTRLTQSLEREGFLKRERDSADRRYLRLRTTDEGRRFLKEQTSVIKEEFRSRLEGVGDEELKELERMLGVVAEAMKS